MTADKPMGILAKAADVAEVLAERGALSPADIADQVGMPRSSVYRLTEALTQARLTETLSDSRIRLTLRWLQLADAARAGMTEWSNARSVLDELADSTGLTAFLSVPRGGQALCIDWARGRAINVLLLKPGRSLPLHAGAAGRVTLAFSDEPAENYLKRAPFPAFTSRTLITAAQLRKDVAVIRRRGYSISDADVTVGIGAVGVPLLTSVGRFVGALSIGGLAEDVTKQRDGLVDRLRIAAEALVPPD